MLAHKFGTNYTMATVTHTAFHSTFQREVNLVVGKVQIMKVPNHKSIHDGWTTNTGDCILGGYCQSVKKRGYDSDIASPAMFIIPIDGGNIFNIPSIFPEIELIFV
jgi:hypothetical protein